MMIFGEKKFMVNNLVINNKTSV